MDVLVARQIGLASGEPVVFDEVWQRREYEDVGPEAIAVPSIPDLIATKRAGGRPKDAEDIRLLMVLEEERRGRTKD